MRFPFAYGGMAFPLLFRFVLLPGFSGGLLSIAA